MRKNISIAEYVISNSIELSVDQLTALRQYSYAVELLAGDTIGTFKIKASQWVGTILIPGLSIHVEPKIGSINVLQMLLQGDGEAIPRENISLIKSDEQLWDLVALQLCNEVSKIYDAGLAKNYVIESDNLVNPRGQINHLQDFMVNVPVRTGIFCQYDSFTDDIFKNQALAWGLETVRHLVSQKIIQRIEGCRSLLANVTSPNDIHEFTLPEPNDQYRLGLYFVKLIKKIENLGTAKFGSSGAGYLLDMNKVFEGFVRSRLRKELSYKQLNVPEKGSQDRELCIGVNLEPDIIIQNEIGNIVAIADCKYKRNWDGVNTDVYQMLAYLEGFEPVKKAFVIYPTMTEAVEYNSWNLPRGRLLTAIGLPYNKLLDAAIWKIASDEISLIEPDLATGTNR